MLPELEISTLVYISRAELKVGDGGAFKLEKRQVKLVIFEEKNCLPPFPAVSTKHVWA